MPSWTCFPLPSPFFCRQNADTDTASSLTCVSTSQEEKVKVIPADTTERLRALRAVMAEEGVDV